MLDYEYIVVAGRLSSDDAAQLMRELLLHNHDETKITRLSQVDNLGVIIRYQTRWYDHRLLARLMAARRIGWFQAVSRVAS